MSATHPHTETVMAYQEGSWPLGGTHWSLTMALECTLAEMQSDLTHCRYMATAMQAGALEQEEAVSRDQEAYLNKPAPEPGVQAAVMVVLVAVMDN